MPAAQSTGDRILYILSDIEMGAGGLADDFPHDDFLAELILGYGEGQDPNTPVDLVLNGDTLDFLRTQVASGFPAHITAELACEKLDRIAAAHEGFFAALRRFLASGDRTVHFTVGNHDPEILFPEVQVRIAQLCGEPYRVHFPGFELDMGPVHIEHGSQQDPMFRMEPDQTFIGAPEGPILNLSWGALALLDIWMMLKAELFALDRIKPRDRLFQLLPDARALMLKRSWRYWSHDFWRDFKSDPLKRVTWSMVKEVGYRFLTADADIVVRDRYRRALEESPASVFVVGHEHHASRSLLGDKTLITSGCMRNEYIIQHGSDRLAAADKGAVELRLRGDRVVRHTLMTYAPPEPPPGHAPDHVLELAPLVDAYMERLTASGSSAAS